MTTPLWYTMADISLHCAGQKNPPLSEDGALQAECVAQRLMNEKVDYVYTSDLIRAKQTADKILEKLTAPPRDVIEDIGLRERHFGEHEGQHISEYRAYLAAEGYSFRTHEPKGGESFAQARERVVKVFLNICAKCLEEDASSPVNDQGNDHHLMHVLVVGHGLVFKELLSYFIDELKAELPGGKERVMKDSANSNVSRFVVDYRGDDAPPTLECRFLYDFSHMPEDMQKALPSKAY